MSEEVQYKKIVVVSIPLESVVGEEDAQEKM